MSQLAVTGSPPGLLPGCNVFDWVFSNPFVSDSEVLRNAPAKKEKDHAVVQVPADKPIIVSAASGTGIGWHQLRVDALKVAASLKALIAPNAGARDTPVVMIHLPNCLQYGPTLLGVFAAGLTATLVNPALTPTELRFIINSARPTAIITTAAGWTAIQSATAGFEASAFEMSVDAAERAFIVDPTADYGRKGHDPKPSCDARPWEDLLMGGSLSQSITMNEKTSQEQTAVILWSSGTSGRSKGVKLSHRALIVSLVGLWHVNLQYDSHERWLGFIPFHHVFGLLNILLLAPCCGATVYAMLKFDPQIMLDMVQRHRITYLHLAPPVALLLAKSPMVDGINVSSVRGIVSGGAPLGRETIELVYRRLGLLIHMGYGMSEACSICTQEADTWHELEPQLGSCGRPLYGVELKIVSTDDPKQVLRTQEDGQILVRGPCNTTGYLENPAATRELIDDEGWLVSGDIGRIDLKGRLWITDRLKEVIKVKGLQVSPSDLEAVLCASPLIADAGVIGIHDSEAETELPRAFIVPADENLVHLCKDGSKPDTRLLELAQQIQIWTEERMANYKWLRGNIVFVPQIPKSPAGKILRRLLKDTKGVEHVLYKKKQLPTTSKL